MTVTLDQIRLAGRRETIRAARRDVGHAAIVAEKTANAISEALRPIIVGDHDTVAWATGDWRKILIALGDAEEQVIRLRSCLNDLRRDAAHAARVEQDADVDAG